MALVANPAKDRYGDGEPMFVPDFHGNTIAREGCDRCFCGCKYWEDDQCIDCGTHISKVKKEDI